MQERIPKSLHLFPAWKMDGLKSFNLFFSENTGISEVWETISRFNEQMSSSNWKIENRKRQEIYWLHHTIKEELGKKTYKSLSKNVLNILERQLLEGKTISQILKEI